MYTFEMQGQESIGGILLIMSVIWAAVWGFIIGLREFVGSEDRSGAYRAFTVASCIIVTLTIVLCAAAKSVKPENIPVKATYVSHVAVADTNLFRATVQLEDGTLVQVQPYPSIKPTAEQLTVYWNKPR